MKPFEKETSIFYNEADDTANIYTYNVGLMSRLDRLCESRADECKKHRVIDDSVDAVSKEFIVPKSWVVVRPPKKMNLTEERRQELSERMKLLRGKDRVLENDIK